jgi:hypothetical protein
LSAETAAALRYRLSRRTGKPTSAGRDDDYCPWRFRGKRDKSSSRGGPMVVCSFRHWQRSGESQARSSQAGNTSSVGAPGSALNQKYRARSASHVELLRATGLFNRWGRIARSKTLITDAAFVQGQRTGADCPRVSICYGSHVATRPSIRLVAVCPPPVAGMQQHAATCAAGSIGHCGLTHDHHRGAAWLAY